MGLNLKTNKQKKTHPPKNPNAIKKRNPNHVKLKVTVEKFQPSPQSSFTAHPNTHLLFLSLWGLTNTPPLERMAADFKRITNR